MRINGLESDNWRVQYDDDGEVSISGFGDEMSYPADKDHIEELARMLLTLAAGQDFDI